MNPTTKITLSAAELANVTDKEWILTKHRIMETATHLLQAQIPVIDGLFQSRLQALPFSELLSSTPKIAKGENYRGLPYLMLDYPAVFSAQDIFALRTMFWWGNFMSITLHLSGKYKFFMQKKIAERLPRQTAAVYICVSGSQWEHHFEEDNYALYTTNPSGLIERNEFIKLAVKFPLSQWNQLDSLLQNGYRLFSEILPDV